MEIRLFSGCLFCLITPDCIVSFHFWGVFVLLWPQLDIDGFRHLRLTAGEMVFIEFLLGLMWLFLFFRNATLTVWSRISTTRSVQNAQLILFILCCSSKVMNYQATVCVSLTSGGNWQQKEKCIWNGGLWKMQSVALIFSRTIGRVVSQSSQHRIPVFWHYIRQMNIRFVYAAL